MDRLKINSILWICLYFLILKGTLAGQTEVRTNLSLLSYTIAEVADQTVSELSLRSFSKIFVHETEKSDNLTYFIENRFYQELAEKNFKVFIQNKPVDEGLSIYLLITKATVKYEKVYRKKLFSSKWVHRKAEVSILLKAIDESNNKIYWIGDITSEKKDDIPYNKLDFVEQGENILRKPDRSIEKGVKKWVEPFLVMGVLGVVVYLFYSVRSK
jgi:hypothetical protein